MRHDSYEKVKRDFATRSGLLPESALFTLEQRVELYLVKPLPERVRPFFRPFSDSNRWEEHDIKIFYGKNPSVGAGTNNDEPVQEVAAPHRYPEEETPSEFTSVQEMAAIELLDFVKIGREHREQEGGVYTGFGYVEQYSECVKENIPRPETPIRHLLCPASPEEAGLFYICETPELVEFP